MKTTVKIFYLFVLVLTSVILCVAEVIQLDSGPISGMDTNGLRIFKGIPYAAPPVGMLRWKPPQSVTPWSTVLNCTNFGPSCPQPPNSEVEGITSEDCLYLNVWTPATNSAAGLPVMVWIHGGGWTIGSGSMARYDGTALAQKGVVFVNLNYRLGPFGFLVHPALSQESPFGVSGNYGLLDQIAALQWVQRNIAAFGGDPGRVTIFGESAGSMSVALHLVCPLSTGLFHRAISESGGSFGESYITPQADGQMGKAIQMGKNLTAALQCDTAPDVLGALRAKTSAEILQVFDFTLAPFSPGMKFAPVIDGYAIPDDPAQLVAGGESADVPLIMGSNADEGNTFYEPMTVERYQYWIQLNFGRRAAEVFAMFPAAGSNDVKGAFDRLAATALFAEPTRYTVGSWSVKHSKAYLYQFARISPYAAVLDLGAYHGSEIPFVFGHIDTTTGNYNDTDAALSSTIMNYWVNFAATGDPNGAGLLAWPSYDPSSRPNMEFGDTNRINDHLLAQECELLGQFHRDNINVPAPGAVFATDGIYSDRVQVSWPVVYGASAYEVWRNTSTDTASAVKQATITATRYDDTSVQVGTVYYYWVRTLSATTNSGASPYDAGYCSAIGGPVHHERNDYDGDGKADLSLYNNNTDQYLWKGLLSAYQNAQVVRAMGKRGDVSVPADYDGDGLTEPAFYNSAAAAWLLLKPPQDILPYVFMLGGPGWAASAADYDGDRMADPVVYRAATAEWQVYLSGSGYVVIPFAGGGPDWEVVSRDYDGDGRTDPAMYNVVNGAWACMLSAGNYATVLLNGFGGPGYAAMPADYDGDGQADPAVYREDDGQWCVLLSASGYYPISIAFGGNSWQAVPSDYDGDGCADPCVFNAATGQWWGLLSGSAYAPIGAVFGASGDSPTGS